MDLAVTQLVGEPLIRFVSSLLTFSTATHIASQIRNGNNIVNSPGILI